jgi:spore coat protein U-like protein
MSALLRRVAMLAVLLAPLWAQASVTCSISSPGFFSVYDSLAATDNLNTSAFTVNCTRLASDPTTFNYIAFTDDGLYNPGGSGNNRAQLTTGTSRIRYDFFTSASYSVNWSKSSKCITGTINFGSALFGSQTQTYYSKIPAAQTGLPQGSYLDTVTVNMSYNQAACKNNAAVDASSIFQVQISNVPACQIVLPPGTVAFTYTAFSPVAATASTTFATRCSTTQPYVMALNANYGVVSGLNYALSLSATSSTGNGALQNYSINGVMAAGQAGECATASCSASATHTLTITY